MSGLKYSRIELEKEKKACQEAEGKISLLTSSIESLREKTKAILGEIPEGVKESFPKEIQMVKDWQSKTMVIPSKEMNSTQLNKMVEELQNTGEKGQESLHLLIEIKEVRREKRARELIGRLERLKADLEGIKTPGDKWKPEEYESIVRILEGFSPLIEQGKFVEVERELNRSEETLAQIMQDVTSLEAQDNQRRYVLNGLRDVCKEMGWGELKEPALEDTSNPSSSLVYKVETYSAGEITFRLTLTGIDVHSPISTKKNACYKDFNTLSDKLKRFGVTTKFERITPPDEKPILEQDREVNLPDEGIERQMEV